MPGPDPGEIEEIAETGPGRRAPTEPTGVGRSQESENAEPDREHLGADRICARPDAGAGGPGARAAGEDPGPADVAEGGRAQAYQAVHRVRLR